MLRMRAGFRTHIVLCIGQQSNEKLFLTHSLFAFGHVVPVFLYYKRMVEIRIEIFYRTSNVVWHYYLWHKKNVTNMSSPCSRAQRFFRRCLLYLCEFIAYAHWIHIKPETITRLKFNLIHIYLPLLTRPAISTSINVWVAHLLTQARKQNVTYVQMNFVNNHNYYHARQNAVKTLFSLAAPPSPLIT